MNRPADIPPALWRRVRDKAGDRLREVLIGLLRAYADGTVDPLSDRTPSQALAARGGQARAAHLTPEQRTESARKAAEARWRKPEHGDG